MISLRSFIHAGILSAGLEGHQVGYSTKGSLDAPVHGFITRRMKVICASFSLLMSFIAIIVNKKSADSRLVSKLNGSKSFEY